MAINIEIKLCRFLSFLIITHGWRYETHEARGGFEYIVTVPAMLRFTELYDL